MTRNSLERLAEITALQQRTAEARTRSICSEEATVRQRLAWLDQQAAAAMAVADHEALGLRRVGGEILWQGWVNRNRRELQMELARILARKGAALAQLKLAYGRSEAIEGLRDKAHKSELDKRNKRDLLREQGLHLIRLAGNRFPG